MGIYLFKKSNLTINVLIENVSLRQRKTITVEQTKQLIRSHFQSDLEIEMNFLIVSLLCPLTKQRIKKPSRGIKCKHVQCFDLDSYLCLNHKTHKWVCPVCNTTTTEGELVVDALFSQILSSNFCENEIQFNSNADWTKVTHGLTENDQQVEIIDESTSFILLE